MLTVKVLDVAVVLGFLKPVRATVIGTKGVVYADVKAPVITTFYGDVPDENVQVGEVVVPDIVIVHPVRALE